MLFKRVHSIFAIRRAALIGLCVVSTCILHVAPSRGSDLVRMRSAAEQGNIQSEIALGDAYFRGQGIQQDTAQAAYWYEKAASSGDALAQNQIGYFYEAGIGVPVDASRAVHWFQLSAASGNIDSKVNLGIAYFWGIGVRQDRPMAECLFREAAERGNSSAMTDLGDMYYKGTGVIRDQQQGKAWYKKAVQLHDTLAEYRMGIILSEPAESRDDLHRALALFRVSAAGGFVPAMHALGLLLINHPELCKSHQEALNAFNEAADAGMWRSSAVLGILARDGKWMPKDPAAAYFHFLAAALQGGSEASKVVANEIEKLSAVLDPNDAAHADAQAERWAQMHKVAFLNIYRNGEHWKQFPTYGQAEAAARVHAGLLIPDGPSSSAARNTNDLTEVVNCSDNAVNAASGDTLPVCTTSD